MAWHFGAWLVAVAGLIFSYFTVISIIARAPSLANPRQTHDGRFTQTHKAANRVRLHALTLSHKSQNIETERSPPPDFISRKRAPEATVVDMLLPIICRIYAAVRQVADHGNASL